MGGWAGNLKFVRVFLGIKSKHVEMMENLLMNKNAILGGSWKGGSDYELRERFGAICPQVSFSTW